MFNTQANKHIQTQALNPFSNGKVGSMPRPKFSKEEYGRPPKGSQSECRANKATIHVCKEMLELCEVINQNGERLFSEKEKPEDPRKVISFGELFHIYVAISDKVVGILLRARKHNIVDFEGETLFQRQDDHVPIIQLKSITDIRKILREKIEMAAKAINDAGESYL